MTAAEILRAAADLSQERQAQHGKSELNMRHLAAMWTAYIAMIPGGVIQDGDAATMMALSKIVRTRLGAHNPDDYIDGAGYLAIAGQLAARKASVADRVVVEHPPAQVGVKLPVTPYADAVCCHKTRIVGSSCPVGRKCPHDITSASVGIGSWMPDADRAKRA